MTVEQQVAQDEISLLDIAVVIAENWIMLLIGPLLAGAIVFAFLVGSSTTVYKARAEIVLGDTAVPLLRSDAVLSHAQADAVGAEAREVRRLALATLQSKRVPDTDFYQLEISSPDAAVARASLEAVVKGLVVSSAPNAELLAEIEHKIAQTSARLQLIERALTSLTQSEQSVTSEGELSGGIDAVALISLLDSQQYHYETLDTLQLQVQGSVTPQNLTSDIYVDTVHSRSSALFAVAAAIGVGFLLLLIAFLREGLKNVARDPEQSQKLSRIRRAFGIKQ
ncbi:hypothetical protein [Devosia sp. WQ 349K1]|uniref:hypothetical protein n=1 Tax=Devosia sp. WQ 349K1 TaxID=2800329 RepID=UPI001AEF2E4D|nr:hypothetical protein [Devosia sp. WQ 349K1]